MNVTNKNSRTIVVWRLSDGRAGHESQSNGLVQAIRGLVGCKCHDIPVSTLASSFLDFINKRFQTGRLLPAPDLIIGAGHATHIPMLCAKRARGGETVVIMKPSLPLSWFDYCLIPSHDKPTQADNIIITKGALNMISTPDMDAKINTSGLIMVGGSSKHYNWDNTTLIEEIKAVINTPGITWQITGSRRTPDITQEALKNLSNDRVRYIPFHKSSPNWLLTQLQHASKVWVTEDSVSMIYEAITSGAAVGVLNVPKRKAGRITSAVIELAKNHMVTTFDSWNSGAELMPVHPPLNESLRCAEILIKRLFK